MASKNSLHRGLIAMTILIPSLCFAGSLENRHRNEKAADAVGGKANVMMRGERVDVLTIDKAIKISDPRRLKKTIDDAIEGSKKSRKDPAIGIIKDDSFSGRMHERQLKRELKKRGLEDDVDIIEIDPEDMEDE